MKISDEIKIMDLKITNEEKIVAMDWIESRGSTILIKFDDVLEKWSVEDIIDNIFAGDTLVSTCLKAIEYYKNFE